MKRNFLLIFLFANTLFVYNLFSQSSSEIYGTVKDAKGDPIDLANVVAKNTSTGFIVGVTTDQKGKFELKDLQLGGPYSITVSFVGYKTLVNNNYTLSLGDRLKIDFILKEGDELEEVFLESDPSYFKKVSRLGSAVSIKGVTLDKVPTTTRNYEDLVNLSPLSTPKIDLGSGSPFGGLSVAGSNGGTTGITLDGVNNRRSVFGGTSDGPAFTISMEAIKEFEIVTNEYDVSGPRSSGGSIKAVTKSGTNDWKVAAWGYLSGGGLSGNKNFNGTSKKIDFKNNQYGLRVSGPIVKDKLSFLAVFDRFQQDNPLGSGGNAKGFVNFNSGIEYPFEASHIKTYVDQLYNLGIIKSDDVSKQTGEIQKTKVTQNYFFKLDWNINQNNNMELSYNHLDFDDSFQAGVGDNVGASFFSRGYPYADKNKKITLTLKSRVLGGFNNLKFSFGDVKRDNLLASDAIRSPKINVNKVDDTRDFNLASGLATWVPEEIYNNNYQLINVFTKKIGDIDYKFGTDLLIFRADENIPHFMAGEFAYDNLSDFVSGKPNFFQKKFKLDPNDDERIKYTSYETALFVQADYNLIEELKLEVGLRWDATIFSPDKDPTNQKLEAITYNGKELINNSKLRDLDNFQPRFNLTWDIKNDGKQIFKFGAGLFSSQFTTQAYTFSLGNSGTRFITASTTDRNALEKIHEKYTEKSGWGDVNNQITMAEYATITGINISNISPDIVVLDPDFNMPSTMKISSSYYNYVTDWLRLGINLYFNNTKNVPYYKNINLKETSQKNKLDGRLIYQNGKNTAFGNIYVFKNSNWSATFWALSIESYFELPNGGNLSLSYTKAESKGYSYYNAGGDIENGKPLSYSYNSYSLEAENWFDPNSIPNKIVLTFLSPEYKGISISGTLIAGQFGRFSAYSTANASGDGIGANNLAYIPTAGEVENTLLTDKSGNDYKPYSDFNTMLSNTSPEFRDYINQNRGKFASYNGGIQPWSYSTNLSLIYNINLFNFNVIARMDIFNLFNVFSYDLGGYKVVSNTNLINYDSSTQKYSVNKDAGVYSQGGDQYRIQFGLKVEI